MPHSPTPHTLAPTRPSQITVVFIFLNLFVAVVISSFQEETSGVVTPEEYHSFAEHWALFDPDATCYIPAHDLERFVATLFAPFGFEGKMYSHKQLLRRTRKIHIVSASPSVKVHFSDVMVALSAAHFERLNNWNPVDHHEDHFDIDRHKMCSRHGNHDKHGGHSDKNDHHGHKDNERHQGYLGHGLDQYRNPNDEKPDVPLPSPSLPLSPGLQDDIDKLEAISAKKRVKEMLGSAKGVSARIALLIELLKSKRPINVHLVDPKVYAMRHGNNKDRYTFTHYFNAQTIGHVLIKYLGHGGQKHYRDYRMKIAAGIPIERAHRAPKSRAELK